MISVFCDFCCCFVVFQIHLQVTLHLVHIVYPQIATQGDFNEPGTENTKSDAVTNPDAVPVLSLQVHCTPGSHECAGHSACDDHSGTDAGHDAWGGSHAASGLPADGGRVAHSR